MPCCARRTRGRIWPGPWVHDHADGRGLLLITHRLVGLERMDEVLVLDEGQISECGTHAELFGADGVYRRMVEVQYRMLAAR